ncbi:hypothetical protein PR202_ga25786 [Eleusine coracana subsp. coracana]|uniref:BTB domain-containing protein n=1 Tax=Eleusine coracana subsp. coracana TaxID=191504 RepID=A0AAV5DCL0_ELECO|nr:hypothetical protein PR202_ga25786 [Eleusine coracana subsp. coracana]
MSRGSSTTGISRKTLWNQQNLDSTSLTRARKRLEFSSIGALRWIRACVIKTEIFEKSKYLANDSFTIRCDISLTKDVDIGDEEAFKSISVLMANGGLDDLTSSCQAVLKELIAKLASLNFNDANSDTGVDAVPLVAAPVPPSDIHQDFARLLQSGEGTDMTFQVGNKTLQAHRCVLAARSSVFRNQLFSSGEGMASSSVIRIDNMEPKVIELLLCFIYSDQMPEIIETEGEEVTQQDDDMDVIWKHLLTAADRYELQRLKLLCEEKLCGYINASTVATILALAEQHHCQGLKETCLDFLESPANLQDVMATGGLEHVRSSCSSVLKDLIAKLASLKLDN